MTARRLFKRQQVHQVEVYVDHDGLFRWRFRHANGKVMADSGQGYSRRIDCIHGLSVVCDVPDQLGAYTLRPDRGDAVWVVRRWKR